MKVSQNYSILPGLIFPAFSLAFVQSKVLFIAQKLPQNLYEHIPQQSSDWGAKELSPEQAEYAAGDVLYLHQIQAKLNVMLERESRAEIATQCFNFLPTRSTLDLGGFADMDIFHH